MNHHRGRSRAWSTSRHKGDRGYVQEQPAGPTTLQGEGGSKSVSHLFDLEQARSEDRAANTLPEATGATSLNS